MMSFWFKKIDIPLAILIDKRDIEGIREKICYGIIVGVIFGTFLPISVFFALHMMGIP